MLHSGSGGEKVVSCGRWEDRAAQGCRRLQMGGGGGGEGSQGLQWVGL